MKKISKKIKLIIISSLIIITPILFVSFDNDNFEIAKNLDIYYTLFRELNLYYVDEIDPGDLIKTSMDEMLKSLDPYTVFIPESKIEDFKFMTTGQYGGVGAIIRKSGDYVVIAEPYENAPVHKAGIEAGDIITKIEGKSTKGKSIKDISELLKGQPNTKVKLTMKRKGVEKPFDKNITRKKIQINSVPYSGMLNDSIGYIKLNVFTENSSKDVKKAILDLKEKQNAKAFVFDLRNNPGGLLNEAVNICNFFVDKGQTIVTTKGKVKQWNKTYKATNQPIDTNTPLVILVNRGSASASEIVSGTMQDLDRAVIIGQRTYGKGLVQTTRSLSYNSKLKVTTAKYYIPSGRCIQALDYSHRNEDGSVGKIPDTLVTKFSTNNGRTVYDGGGILPDIKIEPEYLSKIAICLVIKNLIFDFATDYKLSHDSIESATKFNFTDSDYENFIDFIADKKFDYKTQSEKKLAELKKIAKKEKYYDRVSKEFEILQKDLAHDKDKDLITFKGEIKELIKEEIISRYYFQKGRISSSLSKDPKITEALKILGNNKKYSNLLSGNVVEK
ncbi:MAG: S41 family peptidase [Bacteroidales bacterium]|nr:S41 family peptidase [Bacteroidales bacterium]